VDQKPFYSGITGVKILALNIEERHPWLSKYVGEGSCFMFDEGRVVICQRNGNGVIRTYAALRKSENWLEECGIDWSNHDAVRETLVREYFNDCG
jgi:hypothetical protein